MYNNTIQWGSKSLKVGGGMGGPCWPKRLVTTYKWTSPCWIWFFEILDFWNREKPLSLTSGFYSQIKKALFYKILFIQTYFFLNHIYLGMTRISDSRRARWAVGSNVRLFIRGWCWWCIKRRFLLPRFNSNHSQVERGHSLSSRVLELFGPKDQIFSQT